MEDPEQVSPSFTGGPGGGAVTCYPSLPVRRLEDACSPSGIPLPLIVNKQDASNGWVCPGQG